MSMHTDKMSPRRPHTRLLLCAGVFLCACADDLAADATDTEIEGARVVTEASAAGESITRVDASNAESWVYFSFESGAEVMPADPASAQDWDLAFQRFHIISNGGVSGSAGAAVAVLPDQPFADLTTPPADGYLDDQPDSDDDDEIVDSAFASGDGWYDYDGATNRLSPRPIVYVVKTGRDAHYKLELLDYYDAAGTSGHPSFAWAPL